ncbi:MAG: hypothetical protein HY390_06315 [Deltaproteobacteria bacterium]|nr:hypothetical protein [Deltaproteobacteria bacterium]
MILKYTFLAMIASLLSLPAIAGSIDTLPTSANKTKLYLDTYFHPERLRSELYQKDKVDAGNFYGGPVSRKDLESGKAAVFRYGTGRFPSAILATSRIEKFQYDYLFDSGIDPTEPDEALDEETLREKQELLLAIRKKVGYTFAEQQKQFEEERAAQEKKTNRTLTDPEIEKLKISIAKRFPTFDDPQSDETEGLAIINNTHLDTVYSIIRDRDAYKKVLSEYFLYSYVLKDKDFTAQDRDLLNPNRDEDSLLPSERGLGLPSEHNQILFSQFKITSYYLDYPCFNEATQQDVPITLHTKEGDKKTNLKRIIAAWRIDPRLKEDGRFVPTIDPQTKKIVGGNGKFGPKNIHVVDGYILLEPYIVKDAQGFESISETQVLALYHAYMRIDDEYGDLTGLPQEEREQAGRRFMSAMMNILR